MDKAIHVKVNKRLKGKLRSRSGMTMAEMMVTVAVVVVLSAVAFIAIISYQRNLALRERDAAAQEIFVAAQNHLTMTRGEGYLEAASSEQGLGMHEGNGIYYFVVNGGSTFNAADPSMLDLMLPFGSVDESIRVGGSYVIRYQPETALILDVFYCSTSGAPDRFNHTIADDDEGSEYAYLITLNSDEKKDERRTYTYPEHGKAVLGWYGGEDLEPLGYPLQTPEIDVENGDKLTVRIHNPNFSIGTSEDGLQLKLIITGQSSEAKMSILITPTDVDERLDKNIASVDGVDTAFAGDSCSYDLDDVTGTMTHFADIIKTTYAGGSLVEHQKGKQFEPGEDIRVEAVAYSSKKLARIMFSEAEVENSLYDSISRYKKDTTGSSHERTAYTSSIRHIENLDPEISGIRQSDSGLLFFTNAKQVEDITWGGDVFKNSCKVFKLNESADAGTQYYRPVNPVTLGKGSTNIVDTENKETKGYDGLKHYIKGVKTDFAGDSGLFGATGSDMTTKNLELIDFDIKAKGSYDAGALAGSVTGKSKQTTAVSNVVAYNTQDHDLTTWKDKEGDIKDYRVEDTVSGGRYAGGLVGQLTSGKIEYSGAALTVSGVSAAGGLAGHVSDADVDGCFSGGHTQNGSYCFRRNPSYPIYNIKSPGPAGGLIGSAENAAISDSYSTCSALGSQTGTGGFVGTATGSISNCYCTGLTAHDKDNAFIGSGGATIADSCRYFEIVNETSGAGATSYKKPGNDNVKPFDDTLTNYNNFVGEFSKWREAGKYKKNNNTYEYAVYDNDLDNWYDNHFTLKSVIQLKNGNGAAADKVHFVNNHYGDWPSPEMFIVNEN